MLSSGSTPDYYVFNSSADNGGFVIVSGDDRMPEIIGYSDCGFFDTQNIPDALSSGLAAYSALVNSMRDCDTDTPATGIATPKPVVEPLLTTEWDQEGPYNSLTPVDATYQVHCPTGCAATAVAQVMNYHKYPASGFGSYSYTTKDWGTLSADFSKHNYDWSNMLDKYSELEESSWTKQQEMAVAQLMSDVGIALKMHYQITGSGAYETDIAETVAKYFGYRAKTVYRETMPDSEYIALLKDALDKKLPVAYCGATLSSGHEFVLDGYDTNGYFHVNWGWGGLSDGYYSIQSLYPPIMGVGGGNNGFDLQQSFVVMQPGDNCPMPYDQRRLRLTTNYWIHAENVTAEDKKTDFSSLFLPSATTVAKGADATVKITNIANSNTVPYSGKAVLAITDNNGRTVALSSETSINISGTLSAGGFHAADIMTDATFNLTDAISSISDGEYQLKLVTKQDGYTEWVDAISFRRLNISIADGKASFSMPVDKIEAVSITRGNKGNDIATGSTSLLVTLHNHSNTFALVKIRLYVKLKGSDEEEELSPETMYIYPNSDACHDFEEVFLNYDLFYNDDILDNLFEFRIGECTSLIDDQPLQYTNNSTPCEIFVKSTPGAVCPTATDFITVTASTDSIVITGTDSPAAIYNTTGALVAYTNNRRIQIDSHGVYIVRIGDKSWKIIL